MKKVSLVLGMVLAASFAMAQNVSNTTQTGSDNGVAVTQAGVANLLNNSQTGDDNTATISQTSTGVLKNEVLVEQGGGIYEANPGDDNVITVTQTGKIIMQKAGSTSLIILQQLHKVAKVMMHCSGFGEVEILLRKARL